MKTFSKDNYKDRVLPALGEEYDRVYTISKKDIDIGLFERSGYVYLHRPYFAMKGSTHALCEINPHKRTVVDAGKDNAKLISFSEFLNLFQSN